MTVAGGVWSLLMWMVAAKGYPGRHARKKRVTMRGLGRTCQSLVMIYHSLERIHQSLRRIHQTLGISSHRLVRIHHSLRSFHHSSGRIYQNLGSFHYSSGRIYQNLGGFHHRLKRIHPSLETIPHQTLRILPKWKTPKRSYMCPKSSTTIRTPGNFPGNGNPGGKIKLGCFILLLRLGFLYLT